MINEIIIGISQAINREFGRSCIIHTEEKVQGLKEPCFFIFPLSPTYTLYRGRRYYSNNSFMIQFLPGKSNPRERCNQTAERLFDCLETITVAGDRVRGTNMGYEIVDDILHFKVNYNMFLHKPLENEKMERYRQKTEVER